MEKLVVNIVHCRNKERERAADVILQILAATI